MEVLPFHLTLEISAKWKITIHPVTYNDIPDSVFESIEYKEIVIEKTIKERALEVFQIFLNISIFIDFEDFLSLDNFKLGKLYYETQDFFHQNVNQSLIENIKEEGKKQNKQIYTLLVSEFDELNKEEQQKILLDSFEMLLTYENEELNLINEDSFIFAESGKKENFKYDGFQILDIKIYGSSKLTILKLSSSSSVE